MTRHGIVTQARQEPCTACHACPPSLCRCDPDAVHLCRAARAALDGLITYRDLASEMRDKGIFDGRTLLYDTPAGAS